MRELAFTTVRIGSSQQVARFTCSRCGKHFDIPHHRGRPSPENLAKTARKAGWSVKAWHPGENRCSSCQRKRPHNVDEFIETLIVKPDSEPISEPTPDPIPIHELEEAIMQQPPREPTFEQRARIRTRIESYFDDELGCYAPEWSDQRIAEEIDVPRITVETIRELAYGPIRITAEQVHLRTELAAIQTALAALDIDGRILTAMQPLSLELRAELTQLKDRLDALTLQTA